jgi:hypothetical protein
MNSSVLRSASAISTIIFWLTFLVASAPHRVHHLLEDLAPSPSQSPTQWTASPANALEQTAIETQHKHNGKHAHRHSHARANPESQGRVSSPATNKESSRSAAPPLHANAPKQDANHNNHVGNDCVVQSLAKQSQLDQPHCPVTVASNLGSSFDVLPPRTIPFSFVLAPFSQRAPPTV